MIIINDLSKSYGARTLFEGVSLNLNPGSCYGIVGANGSGKSTFLKILSGQEDATDGDVVIPKRLRVGVLRQDHFRYENDSILSVVLMGDPILWEAIREKEAILANSHIEFDGVRYGELEDVILQRDGYSFEARAAQILEGLNIPEALHQEPMSILSGGFKLRVLLAQTLASDPDVLFLDEPTNHLDILSIRWLETFLEGFAGCVAIVSHDRRFLESVCTHILDVDYERITAYTGSYTDFEAAKVDNRDRKEAEIAKREREIADHKAFIDRFKAKATKARQAQSKIKRMKKIVIEKLPESSRRYPRFHIKAERPSGKRVVTVEGVSKSYDDKQVLHDVGFTIDRGERVAIIGPNGIGKSTLLKIMAQHVGLTDLHADAGEVEWGYATQVGYFGQDHGELHGSDEDSIHDWLWNHCPQEGTGFVRGKLAEVLFSQDDVTKKIKNLSGGEASRLIFCRLGVAKPNVLVLDEPTNHLDLEGIESLCRGLEGYDGTLLFVSHDRWFIERLATRIIELTPNGVQSFRGGYEDYLRWRGDDRIDVSADARTNRRLRRAQQG